MLELPRPFERLSLLSGRTLLGLYFILPGILKITDFSQTNEYMAAHGVPLIPLLLPLTIIIQIAGGLALIFGFRTRLVAFCLASLILVINVFMHNFWAMPEGLGRGHELQNFIKNLAIMAGLLYVAGARLQGPTEKSG
ncbi:MAG: putative oxidoreductase [Halieaceae bacterium]|jgi:putative oxidoreductase